MLLTEEEAKTKWCPFARIMDDNGRGGGNRMWEQADLLATPVNSDCCASECMAWRTGWKSNPNYKPMPQQWPDTRTADQMNPTLVDHTRGFCGLAGKP